MEGLERIKILASEVKDNDLLKIVDYLLTRNDMNEKYLNDEKSLTQMVKFINDTAKSEIDKKKAKNNGFAGSFFSDDVVFGWAIHYWDESNNVLGLVNSQKEEKEELEEEPIVEEKKENKANKWVAEGQLTLFDL